MLFITFIFAMLKDYYKAAMPTPERWIFYIHAFLVISGIIHPCETVMVSKSLVGL